MATPKKIKPSKTKPAPTESRKELPPKAAPKPEVKGAVPAPAAAPKRPPVEKPSKKSALRDSILARKAAMKPIAFSLDEVRAIAKTVSAKAESNAKLTKVPAKPSAALHAAELDKPTKPNHVKAASLADILGFNPKRAKAVEAIEARDVPEKFKRFHKLLMDMRKSLTEGIERHSEETLKRSVKEDAGDLSAYGQHMADAGTDTFDRDFALSLVSSEQEALSEIDAAIKRIRDGTYGVCEITAKPISKERLLAVPFTRYSAEAQKQIERNRHHSRTQAGLFGEAGEEGGKIMEEDSGEE
jgi:RNA polymerase-binding transcription factor DksA